MTENPVNIKFTKQGGLLIAPKTVGDASANDGIKIPATSTASGAGFGESVADEDRLFASEREPIGILLTYGMAQDITEKWFMINDPDTEEADPALDRMVQDALSTLKYKSKLTRAVAERRIYGWSLLAGAFTDATKPADLKKPLRVGSELKQLNVYNKTNVRVVSKDLDEMSPRFGQPVIYELNRGNGILTEIHFSRVCTIPDDIATARSVLDGVWDDMTCGRNIRWGVSQYIYRIGSAFPVVGFPAGTTIKQLQAYDASNAFRDLMSRTHILTAQNSTQENTGMTFEFKGAAGATLDPTNFFKTNDEQISKASGIPQPSLVGAQAGAVTGSEVNMQSKYKVVSRDQQELEDVNRWVIDRLAESGQISLVASSTATDKLKAVFNKVFGKDYRHKTAKTYTIEWNSAFELSEKDEASIEQMHTASNVNKLKYMSKDEVRAEDGLDPLPDGAGEWKDEPTGLGLFQEPQKNPDGTEKEQSPEQKQMNQADKFLLIDLSKKKVSHEHPNPSS